VKRDLIFLTDVNEQYPWATERYLRRLRQQGKIRYFKRGRRILFAREDIEALAVEGPES